MDDSIIFPPGGLENSVVKPEPYIPDFSMKPATDIVYLKLSMGYYIASRRATFLARSKHSEHTEDEVFQKECLSAKLLKNINSISDTAEYKNEQLSVMYESENRDKENDDSQLQTGGEKSKELPHYPACQGIATDLVSDDVSVIVEVETNNVMPSKKDDDNVSPKETKKLGNDEQMPLMNRTDLNVHLSNLPV